MGYKIGESLESCAKSHLGLADEHAQLAKHHGKLANKSTSDDHANISKCHERIADHHADLAHQLTRAAKSLGGLNTNDDSQGIDELKAAGGKFGMVAALQDDGIRPSFVRTVLPDMPDLSKVPAEFADLVKLD